MPRETQRTYLYPIPSQHQLHHVSISIISDILMKHHIKYKMYIDQQCYAVVKSGLNQMFILYISGRNSCRQPKRN